MSEAMTNDAGDDGPSETVRTNVEVDRQLWRQVRAAAITGGKNVSKNWKKSFVNDSKDLTITATTMIPIAKL